MKKLIVFVLLGFTNILLSQNEQTIRGIVLDNDIKIGITDVNIYLLDSINVGAISNLSGRFTLEKIPVGRHKLHFSALGYKPLTLPVLVTSGKSVYLEVKLMPEINSLEEVVITVNRYDKRKAQNSLAITSARTFSIEETEKYAGSLGDPARMAQNFAGVSSAGDSRNDIVIRGNTPFGLLWRIDGVDVTNPNHFGAKGSTGGPITILNNNTLTNSDFFTSTFPAEYGNAFSGVFDLKMRKGNSTDYEKILQIGWNGLEFGLEGPIKKDESSFIISYRYADLKFLEKLNFNIGVNGVPQYQDLTIKMDFNTQKAGTFSFGLIGGLSNVKIERGEIGQNAYEALWDVDTKNDKIITYLSHKIKLNEKSSLKSYVSYSQDKNRIVLDSVQQNKSKFLFTSFDETDFFTSVGTTYRKRINQKNIIDAGVRIYKQGIKYIDSTHVNTVNDKPIYYVFSDAKEKELWQTQFFIQWKHNFSDNIFSSIGVNYNRLYFNKTHSVEPRLGISYIHNKHRLGVGYGLVGKALPFITYFTREEDTGLLKNYNLSFISSHQFAVSDNILVSPNFRIKVEAYLQNLFNVPIEKDSSSFSLINFGAEFFQERPDNLFSSGKGKNYGAEITVEKFLNNNWYLLSTLSLFKSKYLASDNKWRNTQFDKNYIFNLLGGYEIALNNKTVFQINNKLTLAGGNPLKEYLSDGSIDQKNVFTRKSKRYFRNDVRFSFVKNHKNKSHELNVDFQNITNTKNEYVRNYNEATQKEEISYQMGFLPIVSYRLTF